ARWGVGDGAPPAARPWGAGSGSRMSAAGPGFVSPLRAAFLAALPPPLAIAPRLYFQSESNRRLADDRAAEVLRYNEVLERIIGSFRTPGGAPGGSGETVATVEELDSLARQIRRQFGGRARASLLHQVAAAPQTAEG